jgi:hypothetical protein
MEGRTGTSRAATSKTAVPGRALRRWGGAALVLFLLTVPMIAMAAPEPQDGGDSAASGGGGEAGALLLRDDDTGQALFELPNMLPGQHASRCMTVNYEGPQAAPVLLRGDAGGGLDGYLDMKVEVGTGGGYASCDGFDGQPVFDGTLASFASEYGSGSPGLETWTASSDAPARTFRFTFALRDDQAAAGHRTNPNFSWHVSVPEPASAETGEDAGTETEADAELPPTGLDLNAGINAPRPDESTTDKPIQILARSGAAAQKALALPPKTSALDTPIGKILTKLAAEVAKIAPPVIKGSIFPLGLAALVGAFFWMQSRIDRNDPKLALAPMYAEPDLDFDP